MNTLVIDDDPVSRLALSELVGRLEFGACSEFGSATDAWEYLRLNPPPMLICCDVRMPGIDGIEFLRLIKERQELSRIPFVLVTSATGRTVVSEAVRLGASGYIVKPFSTEDTLSRLRTVIDGSWMSIAEDPSATLRRLALPAPKLNVYYSAFRRQIDEALTKIAEHPGSETESKLLGQLDALQTGCLTLGLWHGARIIDALKANPNPRSALKLHLIAVGQALDMQRKGIRDGTWRQEAN